MGAVGIGTVLDVGSTWTLGDSVCCFVDALAVPPSWSQTSPYRVLKCLMCLVTCDQSRVPLRQEPVPLPSCPALA